MRTKTLTLLLIVFLASCAMPETRIYSLHMPDPAAPPVAKEGVRGSSGETNPRTDATIAVLVSSPRYLTQPYIAYRSSPYQLSISKYSKWDSPPDEIVQAAFRGGLSSTGLFREVRTSHMVPNGFYSLKIDLKRFERSDEGELSFGEVAFDISLLSPEGKSLYQSSITKKIKLEDRSFLSLARGLSGTLVEGVAEAKVGIEKYLRQ
jgi:uncharacterized lipoprotein YmbA